MKSEIGGLGPLREIIIGNVQDDWNLGRRFDGSRHCTGLGRQRHEDHSQGWCEGLFCDFIFLGGDYCISHQ